jgi:peptidoglycan/LPS O-acetylase OafA/YrhL
MVKVADMRRNRWWVLALAGAVVVPVFTVLWLGVTLTSDVERLPTAMVKIAFTIAVVGTAALGIKWRTAAGVALLVEFLVVAVWILVKVDVYSPTGLLRTSLLLAAPLAVSGVLYVLAGGMEAGTWPPSRSRKAG